MKLLFVFAFAVFCCYSAIQAKEKDVGERNSKIQDESSLLTNYRKKRGTKRHNLRKKTKTNKKNEKNKKRIQKNKNKKRRGRGRKSRKRQRKNLTTCRQGQESGNSTAWETCLEHSITSMRRYKEVVANFRNNLTQIVRHVTEVDICCVCLVQIHFFKILQNNMCQPQILYNLSEIVLSDARNPGTHLIKSFHFILNFIFYKF